MNNAQHAEKPTGQAVITVAHIFPADQGRSARLKSADGVFYGFWPNRLSFVVGEAYQVEFTITNRNNVAYRDITAASMVNKPAPAPAQFTGQQSQPPARSLSSAATQPGEKKADSSAYYRPTSPRDSERMFVCSTLNAFIQTGRVDCERQMLVHQINELRAAWQMTFGSDAE